MTYFVLTITFFAIIIGIRNELVFSIRRKKIDTLDSMEAFKEFDKLSHHAMIFDLTKWTYKQFYKD